MIKIYAVLTCLVVSFSALLAQDNLNEKKVHKEISIVQNWTHWGLDTELAYKHIIQNNGFQIGLKYFINTTIPNEQNFVFKHRYIATAGHEHFGLSLAYSRRIKLIESKLEMHPFFKMQYLKLRVKSPFGSTNPIPNLNSSLGIAFQLKLYQQFYLKTAADVGMFQNLANRIDTGRGIENWELSYGFQAGLAYRF